MGKIVNKIRLARETDIPEIVEIWNDIIRNTSYTFTDREKTPQSIRQEMKEKRAAGEPFIVAQNDLGNVVGFATYGPFRAGPGYRKTQEITIYAGEETRGTGAAQNLFLELEDLAKTRGITCLVSAISGANQRAIAFHEKMGFALVGRMPDVGWKFDRPQELVLMQKAIT